MYKSERERKLDESEKKIVNKNRLRERLLKKKRTTLESTHFLSSQIKLNLGEPKSEIVI